MGCSRRSNAACNQYSPPPLHGDEGGSGRQLGVLLAALEPTKMSHWHSSVCRAGSRVSQWGSMPALRVLTNDRMFFWLTTVSVCFSYVVSSCCERARRLGSRTHAAGRGRKVRGARGGGP